MRSAPSRSGLPALLVAILAMLGIGAAAAPHSSAAGKRTHGPAITVKTARRTRGTVVLHVKVRSELGSAEILLDGHRVDADPPRHRGGRRAIVLDRADGVHFGLNRIVVKVRTRGGATAVVRKVVRVRRDAPLPAIEQPRQIVVSHAARLDGRKTRSAHGGKLSFRWQVVGAPDGAKVSLRGANSRRPRLLASVPGHYRIALTVNEQGKKAQKDARGATASAVESAPDCAVPAPKLSTHVNPGGGPIASTPLAQLPKGSLTVVKSLQSARRKSGPWPQAVPGCATTVSEVDVEANYEPIGVAIDTRAEYEETEGIRIGDSFYPFPVNGEGGARFVVLDAQTLEPIRTLIVNSFSDHLVIAHELADEYDGNVLIVSSCRYAACTQDPADAYSGWSAIESWSDGGRTAVTENQGAILAAGDENYLGGELSGWLRPGVPVKNHTKELFAFVNPERFAFDTEASSTSFSNTIRVGSTDYPASLPPASVAGFEVLVLSPGLEPQLGTPVAFGTSSTTAGEGQAQEETMTALLNQAGPRKTVIVQSIGYPEPSSGAATALGQAMARMGASPWTFYALDGGGGYAFVGNGYSELRSASESLQSEVAETSEGSTRAAGGTVDDGSLHGLLTRDAESGLSPDLSDAVGTPNYELDQVTYQPGVAWPLDETAGEIAATRYLAEALHLIPGEGSCYRPEQPDFRSSYCDRSLDISATENELERQTYPAGENVPFTAEEFKEVKKELETELDDVGDVREMMSALQVPLGGQSPAVDAGQIAGEVLDALPQGSGGRNATAAKLSLADAILHAGSNVPEVGEVIGSIAAVLGLAGELVQENGQPSPDWQIQAAADEIGGKVKERLAAMSAGLGTIEEILVSDWGKLSTASAAAGESWGITPRGIERQTSTVELGISQWMWKAILPAAFELVEFPGAPLGSQEQLYCVTSIAPTEWSPWRHVPSSSVFYPLSGFEGGHLLTLGAFGMLDGNYSKKSSTRVSPSLAEKIFGQPEQGGAALTAPELFEGSHWTIARPHMIGEESPLKPGYCGY